MRLQALYGEQCWEDETLQNVVFRKIRGGIHQKQGHALPTLTSHAYVGRTCEHTDLHLDVSITSPYFCIFLNLFLKEREFILAYNLRG